MSGREDARRAASRKRAREERLRLPAPQQKDGLPREPDGEKTLLNLRIESACEVRRALAKPIPPPAPLPPVTARLERPPQQPLRHERPRLLPEARDAFASMDLKLNVSMPPSVSAYDRHSPQ